LKFEVDIYLQNAPEHSFNHLKLKCLPPVMNTLEISEIDVISKATTTSSSSSSSSSTLTSRKCETLDFALLPPRLQDSFFDYLDELRVNNLLAKFVKECSLKFASRSRSPHLSKTNEVHLLEIPKNQNLE